MSYVEGPRLSVASQVKEKDAVVTFYWVFDVEMQTLGARVIRQDRYGQKWQLDIPHTHVVTQKVAAGLLGVSVMTINKWVRERLFGKPRLRNGVSVIPLEAIRKIAEARGVQLPR